MDINLIDFFPSKLVIEIILSITMTKSQQPNLAQKWYLCLMFQYEHDMYTFKESL